ncbi:hypothetical protein [Tunturiibacter gelidoferens]|uniref:Uncharacterized protein n=1 Tax=Tunturiibacter gelidiferens TaxID=3069689 RepID=A0A9X0QHE8_9BACT|nr:hypothetical protein [Edaphobacter lichenicola]MBB5330334.1 hypothetical protein [Edaphobacter lichenicola]
MNKFTNSLLRSEDKHPSDEQMVAFINGELTLRKHAAVAHHLDGCWRCLAKKKQMEETVFALVGRRERRLRPHLPPSTGAEGRLVALLNEQSIREEQPSQNSLIYGLRSLLPSTMNPVLASIFVVTLASITLFFIWKQAAPSLSASDLLGKAMANEQALAERAQPGVVYQKLVMRRGAHSIERTVYSDLQRKRVAKAQHLDAAATAMKQAVEAGGVSWDEPLSAIDYNRWRESQHSATDRVKSAGDGLVSVVTSVRYGPIRQESLTMRTSDLHPVRRTIETRSQDTVEIAELSYTELKWSEANEALWEPLSPMLHEEGEPTLNLPKRSLLTDEQLDVAELEARLVLNKLNADANEQIEIKRSRNAVHVEGIVDTTERQHALNLGLRQVAHVVPSILSLEELNARRNAGSGTASIRESAVAAQPAPLEEFFHENSKSSEEMGRVSNQLLSLSLEIQREGNALTELNRRFHGNDELDPLGRSALTQLLTNHSSLLRAAVRSEIEILQSFSLVPEQSTEDGHTITSAAAGLTEQSTRNVSLCRELISSSESSPRTAQSIASEMAKTLHLLSRDPVLLALEPNSSH